MTPRMIQVGTGGFGASWCRNFLPPNIDAGLLEVMAAVDTNPVALANARKGRRSGRYGALERPAVAGGPPVDIIATEVTNSLPYT